MADEVRLSADGERCLAEAQDFCRRANVAIVGADHLLAGTLVVLSESGNAGVPGRAALDAALMLTQGSAEAHSSQVMFGSAARDAINGVAGDVRKSGRTVIDAMALALGILDSGEVNPMFFDSLGVAKAALRAAVMGERAEPG